MPSPGRVQLLALHGYTLNGNVMREQFAQLARALVDVAEVEYLDAPHACSEQGLKEMYPGGRPSHAAPYLTWWKASNDGQVYEGWNVARSQLAEHIEAATIRGGGTGVGIVGFSQGAMVAATVAALVARGELPPVAFVILIAGGLPRARDLAPLFATPVPVRSLHVWGSRDDVFSATAPALADRFAPELRTITMWRGPHVIPVSGPAATAIVDYVRQQRTFEAC